MHYSVEGFDVLASGALLAATVVSYEVLLPVNAVAISEVFDSTDEVESCTASVTSVATLFKVIRSSTAEVDEVVSKCFLVV